MIFTNEAGPSSFFESSTTMECNQRSSSASRGVGVVWGWGKAREGGKPFPRQGGLGDLPHEKFVIKDD